MSGTCGTQAMDHKCIRSFNWNT